MNFKIFVFLLLSFAFLKIDLSAQQSFRAVDQVKKYKLTQDSLPRESIYLHTDRDWYFHGDRIWFSAYLVSGGFNFLSNISELLYVELVEPGGKIVKRELIETVEGRGSGYLTFKGVKRKAGIYKLRAYTNWSRNFGDSYIFSKNIEVITDEDDFIEKEKSNKISEIQFLPESGRLISGTENILAFKAIGNDGLGIPIKGVIYDQDDNRVTNFETEYLGMGKVNFTPNSQKSYYALVNGEKIQLPNVYADGTILSIQQDSTSFQVSIKSTLTSQPQQMLLFAHVRGQIYHASPVVINNGVASVEIPNSKFATGVVTFTLLDSNGLPVAERLSFSTNPVDEVGTSLSLNKQNYKTRELIDLSVNIFDVADASNSTDPATASISVFDDSIQPYNPYQSSIKSQLYLETELKGYIENPGFYFSEEENSKRYLDLLLLTQGWRAYDVERLLDQTPNTSFAIPERGVSVSGSVKTLLLGKSIEDAVVVISSGEENEGLQILTTNNDGEYVASNLKVYGESVLRIKGNDSNGSDKVRVRVNEQFNEFETTLDPVSQFKAEILPTESISFQKEVEEASQITERAETVQKETEAVLEGILTGELEEITVTGKRASNDWAQDLTENTGGVSSSINLEERSHLRDLSIDQIVHQLPGVTVNYFTNTLSINTGFINFGSNPAPIIMVDGLEVDFPSLRNFPSDAIKSVSVLRSATDLAIFGARGAGGALIVTTRDGDYVDAPRRGYTTMSIQGFQEALEFYEPKYGVNVPSDIENQDQRITLHWNPSFDISENGGSSRFWANDVPSRYRVVVQGLTETGIPFYKTDTFFITE